MQTESASAKLQACSLLKSSVGAVECLVLSNRDIVFKATPAELGGRHLAVKLLQ